MMAMCERIIQWLQEHKDEFEDIEYADDVDLLTKCGIPDICTNDKPGDIMDSTDRADSSVNAETDLYITARSDTCMQVPVHGIQEQAQAAGSNELESNCLFSCCPCLRRRNEQRNRSEEYELN